METRSSPIKHLPHGQIFYIREILQNIDTFDGMSVRVLGKYVFFLY